MPSIQGHLFNFALHNRHLLQFRLRPQRWDFNTSVEEFRALCERGARASKLPEGVQVSPVTIDGLPAGLSAEWLLPTGGAADTAILYTHGGGYISGSCSDHRALVAKITRRSGVPTLLFEYRLAPEHPFPAALDDTLTAYRWLLGQGFSAERIIIAGESAGGGLCLAALLAIRDLGLPLPRAAVSISPWADLKLTGESTRTNEKKCLSPIGMGAVCSKYYAGDRDPGEPWISPLYGDLAGLPPIYLCAGGDETMRDDAVRFAEKMTAAGGTATLRLAEGMMHCYPFFAPMIPEAELAMSEICAFIRHQLALPSAALK